MSFEYYIVLYVVRHFARYVFAVFLIIHLIGTLGLGTGLGVDDISRIALFIGVLKMVILSLLSIYVFKCIDVGKYWN